ncbi:urease-like [Malus domestica]|uniref:urease-like n=1 Tax=Malus domestica TaxID=3750 RepID=UPI000498A521
MVIKVGAVAWPNMGDPNASIPRPEPVKVQKNLEIAVDILLGYVIILAIFVLITIENLMCKQAAVDNWVKGLYCLDKRVEAVRKLSKLDMELNDALPNIERD